MPPKRNSVWVSPVGEGQDLAWHIRNSSLKGMRDRGNRWEAKSVIQGGAEVGLKL